MNSAQRVLARLHEVKKVYKVVLASVAALLILFIGVKSVFADPPTPITDCGVISVPGAYILSNDITATGNCIAVTANDVTIDGNGYKITGDNETDDYGVYADGYTGLTIHDLEIEYFGTAIRLDQGITSAIIDHVNIHNNNKYGIYIVGSNNYTITDSTVSTTGYSGDDTGYGIYVLDSTGGTMTGNTFSGSYQGSILVRGASGTSAISSNTFTSENGIALDACDYSDSGCAEFTTNMTVTDNVMTDMYYYGILLANITDSTVDGNSIEGASNGVFLDVKSSDNTISDNTIEASGTAVQIENTSTDNTISNNEITGADTGVSITGESDTNTITENTIDQVSSGFFIDSSDDCEVTDNTITLSNVNYGSGSSSPLLFTWNGEKYDYIADVGRGIPRNVIGEDYVGVPKGSLVPKAGKYSVKISEEYNEIVYFDKLALMTLDHAPGYEVVASLQRNKDGQFFTIADTPSNPMQSCTDMYENDCTDDLKASDDKWSYKDDSNLNAWEMDFGDLSGASRIQLVIESARDYSLTSADLKQIQVKDANGAWVNAYAGSALSSPAGAPRTQVIDLTGKFPTNDYRVRFAYDRTRVNYIAIDTSTQQSYTTNTYAPTTVDLQFRGYSAVNKSFFWDHDYDKVTLQPEEQFALQTGNFTKYGSVAPLLQNTDDQPVIMHHGDHMDIEFPYIAPAPGLERSIMMYNWATFKHAKMGEVGETVNPLPYNGMSAYPPVAPQTYPMTQENIDYLKTWNTRVITAKNSHGMSLPNSTNTTVSGNTITNESPMIGDMGIYVYYENSSHITNNTISGFYNAISIENSEDIDITGNHISDIEQDAISALAVAGLTISDNDIDTTNDGGDGIQVEESEDVTITNNTIAHTTDDGIFFSQSKNVTVSDNNVTDVYDNALDIEDSGPYTATNNTLESTSNGIDVQSNYIRPINGYGFPGAYTGTHVWNVTYTANNNLTYLERTVDLTAATTSAELTYNAWQYSEVGYDGYTVLVSEDNGDNWVELGDFQTYDGTWQLTDIGLTDYIGKTIKLRFEFYTDGGGLFPSAGVYLDDFTITADGSPIFEDDGESGVNGWTVTTDSGNSWQLRDVGSIDDTTPDTETKVFTGNDITSQEGVGIRFAGISFVTFTENTIKAGEWVYNEDDTNVFDDGSKGNTYYDLDNTPAWTLFDIKDSNDDGFADTGANLPFSEAKIGSGKWNGLGQDNHPATTVQDTPEKQKKTTGYKVSTKRIAVEPLPTTPVPTASEGIKLTKALKPGVTSADVKLIQTYLNTHGYPVTEVGKETPYFGPKTKAAVIKFQKAKGLIGDAIVGPKTAAMMK